MKKNYLKWGGVVASIFIASSCKILLLPNYKLTSVPEEGGIRFTQISSFDEEVMAPQIVQNPTTKKLNWYAAPLLALDSSESRIAYIAKSNSFNNLYIKKLGGGQTKVQRTFNKNVQDMTFSPNSENIAFTEMKQSGMDINIINTSEGAAVTQVTATSANELGPKYTANGKTLFYSASDGGRYYIWKIVLETGIKTQFAEGFTPVLTPDEKNLIITRNNKDTGAGEIWMINLERGTETLILSDNEKGYSSPDISPDGKTIVCVGTSLKTETTPQNLDLYTIKLDGTKLTQLTFHGGHDVSPIWSKDGSYIYFLAQRANEKGKFGIWKMNVNK